MTDKIEPVLTAKEWEYWQRKIAEPALRASHTPTTMRYWLHFSPDTLRALANAAMPDDSPYKITRADVDLVREIVRLIGDAECNNWPEDDLGSLATKLGALLPPE